MTRAAKKALSPASLLPGAILTMIAILCLAQGLPAFAQRADYVIHISVDGLRPDAITALGAANAPNFYRLRTEGAFTDNARADYDFTITLPNHTTELTGRGVLGLSGHNWTDNTDPLPDQTLASNKGSYVAGVYDAAHDNGLRTGHYASKSKFSLFATSWDATHGAPDTTGPDNGRNKIDVYVNDPDTAELVNTLVADMSAQPFQYVFLHLADPDNVGHFDTWDITPGSVYSDTIETIDDRLGTIFHLLDHNAQLRGHTAIILTADHGGMLYGHSDPTLREDYTVPFYVWGPGVAPAADLYLLNPATRLNPGTNRPPYSASPQPIRNGEAANMALTLLGLGPVPGSTINFRQDLTATFLPPNNFGLTVAGNQAILTFTAISNVFYDVQRKDQLTPGPWDNAFTNIRGNGQRVTNYDAGVASRSQCFCRVQIHLPAP
jgi:hypothetical protein